GLLAQAKAAGVNVIFNSRLQDADIIATGPASPDGLAREMTWRPAKSDDEPERIDVFFNHHLSPGGYSYLFILDGIATFGCAIVADFKKIDEYFDHSLAAAQRVHPFVIPAETRTGYSYMNFHLKNHATKGDTRYVGEAAGFQDYLFGLGIRYALTSGWLAARSILESRDFDELWTRELGAKQETSLVNRFLYEAGGNTGLSMFVRQAARAVGPRTNPAAEGAAAPQVLDEWQRELDRAYDASATHPITIALADALQHFDIPKSAFIALMDGCRQDLVKSRYETFDE